MKNNSIRHHDQLVYRVNLLVDNKFIKKNIGKVLLALCTFSNKSGIAFPSQYSLARITGYKRETISRLLSRLSSEKWLSKSSKRISKNQSNYKTRNSYKLNIAKITREVGKLLNTIAKENDKKNDHIAKPKSDHTNNTSYKDLKLNTVQAHPSRSPDLVSKVNQSVENEINHQQKLKKESSRKAGLKRYQIQNGMLMCPIKAKREQKEAMKRKKQRDAIKPLLDRFKSLEEQLTRINFKKHFTVNLANELTHLAAKLRLPIGLVAQNNLDKLLTQEKV